MTCLMVVQDTLDTFLDRPYLDEDELDGPDPILAAYIHGYAEDSPNED